MEKKQNIKIEITAQQNVFNLARPFIGGGTLLGDLVTGAAWTLSDWLSEE